MRWHWVDQADDKYGYARLTLDRPSPAAVGARLYLPPPEPALARVAYTAYSAGRKRPWLALGVLHHSGALVLADDVARQVVPDLPTVPVTFSRGKNKPYEPGFVLVHGLPVLPLEAAWKEPERIDALGWDDRPLPPLFRLFENPWRLVAREDVALRLVTATGGDLCVQDDLGTLGLLPDMIERPPGREASGPAEAAFWGLVAGRGDRAAALAHPLYAAAVAMGVDRAPADDTRAAACASPYWAAYYAIHVDGVGRPDTRAAASVHRGAAMWYADAIDMAFDPVVRAAQLERVGFWDAPSFDHHAAHVERERADLRGSPGPRRVATRDLPTLAPVDRYASPETCGPGRLGEFGADLRSDVEAMTAAGYASLGVDPTAAVPDALDALFARLEAVRDGSVKLPRGRKAGSERLALACVLADVLHRGLGWQWAQVEAPFESAAVVSPDRAHALVPAHPIERVARKGARENTVALLFNMLAAGSVPPSAPGRLTLVA